MVMKKVTIITNRGASEEEQVKAAELAFKVFMSEPKQSNPIDKDLKEICDAFGIPPMLLESDQTFDLNTQQIIKTEDAEFDVIKPKELPPSL